MTHTPVGELLVGNGLITYDQLDDALKAQKKTGGLLGIILIEKGLITHETLHLILEKQK